MVKVISNDTKIKIETSQGTLIAKLCGDPNYPGIWLEIDRPEFGNSVAVASSKCTKTVAGWCWMCTATLCRMK